MVAQKLGGIALIVLGLAESIFARKIFEFASQSDSTNIMRFDRWPSWMFPAWIWAMRIGGIIIAVIGIFLILKYR